MKKAIVKIGGQQFVVAEGDEPVVNFLPEAKKTVEFEALMIIDGKNSKVGAPTVKGSIVKAKVLEPQTQADKVIAIRYKAKKRVHKIRGHRQLQTKLQITSIA